jgi:hypothetical protein
LCTGATLTVPRPLTAAEPEDEQAVLAQVQAMSVESVVQRLPSENRQALCAYDYGFSLHAGLSTQRGERKKLERLLRYGLRPPFSQKRLSLTGDGKVRLKLRKAYFTGQTEVQFAPLDFIRRLAAIVPPSRENQTRYYGIFSAHHKERGKLAVLVPKPVAAGKPAEDTDDGAALPREAAEPVPKKYRQPWSALLKRVFGHEMLVCPKCQGKMRLIAMVDSPKVIAKILRHLGLETEPPQLTPARAPPQLDLAEAFADNDVFGDCGIDVDEAA